MTTRKQALNTPPSLNSKSFSFRGKRPTITMISPKADERTVTVGGVGVGLLWDFDGKYGKLEKPQRVRGHYVPAIYSITGLGFDEIVFSTRLNGDTPKSSDAIVIDSITMKGDQGQGELVLPLDRLRIYAVQLAGVYGVAYPPNYRQDFDGGSFQVSEHGAIQADKYGYQMKESDAQAMTGKRTRVPRTLRDEMLKPTAALYKKHKSHHGKFQFIADELNKQFPSAFVTYRQAKELVATCRKPEIGYLPNTGITRKKTTNKKRGSK